MNPNHINLPGTPLELEGEIIGYVQTTTQDPFGDRWSTHPSSAENQIKEEDSPRYNAHTGEEKAVRDFEKTYPTLAQAWKEIQDEQYILFARMLMAYGISNISLGSTLEEPEDVELSLTGIWLRINDKINRLKNLLKRKGKNYVSNEPMIDSFLDIANYGIIAMLVIRNKWKK